MTEQEFNAWNEMADRQSRADLLRSARETMQILLSKPHVWPETMATAKTMLRETEEWANV